MQGVCPHCGRGADETKVLEGMARAFKTLINEIRTAVIAQEARRSLSQPSFVQWERRHEAERHLDTLRERDNTITRLETELVAARERIADIQRLRLRRGRSLQEIEGRGFHRHGEAGVKNL